MSILRILTEPFTIFRDITTSPTTGHYVALDLFKALSFITGLGLMVYDTVAGKSVEPGLILLFLAYGLQNSKMVSKYFDRRTADGNGNALLQAGSETAPTEPVVPVVPAGATVTENKADMAAQEAAAAEAI